MSDLDLLVIGSGSGNSVFSREMADWRIGIVERGVFGGTCLNVGCIPSKMMVLAADRVVEAEEAAALGVTAGATADWAALRDRTFARVDPIAADGLRYRRGQDNVRVLTGDARFTGPHTVRVRGVGLDEEVVA
jgi:mycothione reductase